MTTHTGTFRGGSITLDDAPDLPDGVRVRVVVEPAALAGPADPRPVPPPGSVAGDSAAARAVLEQVAGLGRSTGRNSRSTSRKCGGPAA